MATGDINDCLARIKSALPSRWFVSPTPVLDALLAAPAYALSFCYSLYAYAQLQTRIKTATDGWLDMVAADFFGTALLRAPNQTDASFRARIIANLFRERATRAGVIKVLVDLTGRAPKIFEPLRPLDTGAYGVAAVLAYGVAGGYGCTQLPFQAFVTAFRQLGSGLPFVGGYGSVSLNSQPGAFYTMWGVELPQQGTALNGSAGYGSLLVNPPVGSFYMLGGGMFIPEQNDAVPTGQLEYASLSQVTNFISDADIYAAIDSVKPAATILWTRISN